MESYKLHVLGAGAVGKSSITVQFVQKRFSEIYNPTIEDSYSKSITINNDTILLDILDTAGQDDFAPMRETYMRQGDGFLLVFAVDDPSSFDEIEVLKKDIYLTKNRNDVPIVICANKVDLPEKNWQIEPEDFKEYSKQYNIPIVETSARNCQNIIESFELIVKMMRKQYNNIEIKENNNNVKEISENKFCGCYVQ